jgi:hypothetical protein
MGEYPHRGEEEEGIWVLWRVLEGGGELRGGFSMIAGEMMHLKLPPLTSSMQLYHIVNESGIRMQIQLQVATARSSVSGMEISH